MRGLVPWCLLLALILSGCVEESPEAPTGGREEREDEDPTASTGDEGPSAPKTVNETLPIHWNGTLGTFLHACEYQHTQQCQGGTVVANDNNLYLEKEGAVVRAVEVTLSWENDSPYTARLGIGGMVMGVCDGCNTTHFESVEGTSPVTISVEDLDLPMPADHMVHMYAYNPGAATHQAPFFAYIGLDQAVSMDGWVHVEMPVA